MRGHRTELVTPRAGALPAGNLALYGRSDEGHGVFSVRQHRANSGLHAVGHLEEEAFGPELGSAHIEYPLLTMTDLYRIFGLEAIGEPRMTRAPLNHKPGDKLEAFDAGRWAACVIISIASYAGKSGPGYYAAFDPPSDRCSSFWTNDRMLRERVCDEAV